MKIKSTFKIAFALLLTIIMLSSDMTVCFAAGSINADTNKPVISPKSGLSDNLISTDVKIDEYKNEVVANVVSEVNNGADLTIAEIISQITSGDNTGGTQGGSTSTGSLNQSGSGTSSNTTKASDNLTDVQKAAESVKTTAGYDINLNLYDRITDFYDARYEIEGLDTDKTPGETKITVPECKGLEGSDLMILMINTETGEISLIAPTAFDSETGTITADIPGVGAYCVMHGLPIVTKDVQTEKYPDREVAEQVSKLSTTEVITLDTLLKATEVEPEDGLLEVAEGVFVDTSKYSSAIALSDVAVQRGDDFDYNLSTTFKANLFRDNDKVDWERILDYAGIEYDASEIKEDTTRLTEFDSFQLKDSFVYHIDAATGQVSIIYEPYVCWAIYGELEYEQKERLAGNEVAAAETLDTIPQSAIEYFDVSDIDVIDSEENNLVLDTTEKSNGLISVAYADNIKGSEEDELCIVINGDTYIGMGTFLLFLPIVDQAFPWWIVILAGAILIISTFIIIIKRKDDDDDEQTPAQVV